MNSLIHRETTLQKRCHQSPYFACFISDPTPITALHGHASALAHTLLVPTGNEWGVEWTGLVELTPQRAHASSGASPAAVSHIGHEHTSLSLFLSS
jgi:hypothetical protein